MQVLLGTHRIATTERYCAVDDSEIRAAMVRTVSAALLLVRDSDGGGELPPLQAWELFMRGAEPRRADCARRCGDHATAKRNAEQGCDQLAPVDVSRCLADPDLGASSRAAYFGSISAFYRWWATQGGTNITARLPWPRSPKLSPRPASGPGLS